MVTSVRSASSWRPHPCFLTGQTSTAQTSAVRLEVLEGELREDVADRVRCSRPEARWPSCLRGRTVTPLTWSSGEDLLGVLDDSSILPDVCVPGVMNGAVGVQKLKTFRGRKCADPSARHFTLGTQ